MGAKDIKAHPTITQPSAPKGHVFDLARRFLADTAGLAGSWPELFRAWAATTGLTEAEARDVRLLILRRRVFGAVARHRPLGQR